MYSLVYIPYNEEDDEEEEEEKGSKKKKKMKSKEKRKKEKEKKAAELKSKNQKEETKLRPGDLVITGSADSSIKIWSLISGECFHVSFDKYVFYVLIKLILLISYRLYSHKLMFDYVSEFGHRRLFEITLDP